jgi:hypothetical protein
VVECEVYETRVLLPFEPNTKVEGKERKEEERGRKKRELIYSRGKGSNPAALGLWPPILQSSSEP